MWGNFPESLKKQYALKPSYEITFVLDLRKIPKNYYGLLETPDTSDQKNRFKKNREPFLDKCIRFPTDLKVDPKT